MGYTDTDKLAINTIRVLAVSCPSTAQHPAPTMPMYPAIIKEAGPEMRCESKC
jgi:hypothetical protein